MHRVGNPDLAVLELPLNRGEYVLTVAVFLGGLSAAAAMVIVETLALSTMVSNDLAIPILVRTGRLSIRSTENPTRLVLMIRRITIILTVAVSYGFFRLAGNTHKLADLGMISFVAAAQLGPPILIGALTGVTPTARAPCSACFWDLQPGSTLCCCRRWQKLV